METARIDLIINQGEDWAVQMIFTDERDRAMNLVNPFRMDIRDTTGQVQHTLETDDTDPTLQNGVPGIVVSSSIGLVQLYLDDAVTSDLVPGLYYYDIFGHCDDGNAYAGDQVIRLAQGTVNVQKRITESF